MVIKFESVSHTYNLGTPMEQRVLVDVNLVVESGEYLAIVGHTGSGKSTLIQHMNALLRPTSGSVTIHDKRISASAKAKNLKDIRQKVGLVFQFPEYQLFEETVERDIMFGPMNYGVSEEVARELAAEATSIVGLEADILQQSPFNLSGGQMRRVAIAGILAMEPDVLILDEPTAGLDPRGQKEIMKIFEDLHRNYKKTIILVSHDMDLVCQYAQRLVVMHRGEVKLLGTPKEVFGQADVLNDCGITLPIPAKNYQKFAKKFGLSLSSLPLTVTEFVEKVEKTVERS